MMPPEAGWPVSIITKVRLELSLLQGAVSMSEEQASSKLPGVLGAVLDLSAKLPPPLAYGLGAIVALVVLAGLRAADIPISVIIVLSLIFLSALVSFVYLDARHCERLMPVNEVFREIKNSFERKTFNEPIHKCLDQKWIDRYRGACETHVLIARYRESIDAGGTEEQKNYFSKLLGEVDGYRMVMADRLLKAIEFERGADGTPLIPENVKRPCEERREAINALRQKL
jgi:hypothetical protein